MNIRLTASVAKTVPADVRALLGPPPIVSVESETLYWAMVASFAELVKPLDLIAWFLIKDLVDARVEVHRNRLFKSELMNDSGQRSNESTARESLNVDAVFEKLREIKMADGDYNYSPPEDIEMECETGRNLTECSGESPKTHRDLALLADAWIEPVGQIDALQTSAERRYHAAVHELERRHRNGLARGHDDVVEGEILETTLPPERDRRRGRVVNALPPATRPRRRRKQEAA